MTPPPRRLRPPELEEERDRFVHPEDSPIRHDPPDVGNGRCLNPAVRDEVRRVIVAEVRGVSHRGRTEGGADRGADHGVARAVL